MEKEELIGNSRSSSVSKFTEFVEVTVTSQLSSQVSIYICGLACFTLATLLVAFYYTLEAIHSASEAISTEFLRLRKTRALPPDSSSHSSLQDLVLDFQRLFYTNHEFQNRTFVRVRLIFFFLVSSISFDCRTKSN